jgi:glycosyltransferase involved in cell wall biosynthesis
VTIRLAFFAPLLGTGGTQRHLQQVLSLLDPKRFKTHVYTLKPGGEVEDELRSTGVPLTCLGLGTSLGAPRSIAAIVGTARALRRAHVDIVHGYQWRPALVGALIGRLARVPLVLASKRSLTGDDTRARHAWRRIARGVDTLIVNAEALRTEGEALGMRCRWQLLQNGVDTDRFRLEPAGPATRAAMGLDPTRPVVGTVGRLESRKGHEQFLVAARELLTLANGIRPQLLIVGDGPLRDDLTRQARELGIGDSVHFTGGVADVRPPLAAMDVFVLPSRAEGMSNALLEAMAAARPVVATAVGGNGEVVAGDRTGVLVPLDDTHAMADRIWGLLTDPALASRLGEAAQDFVTTQFGARAMVGQLERLYADRLAARAGRSAA